MTVRFTFKIMSIPLFTILIVLINFFFYRTEQFSVRRKNREYIEIYTNSRNLVAIKRFKIRRVDILSRRIIA